MPITISKEQDRPFASIPKAPSTHPRYMVTASNECGSSSHPFVDLDSALSKIRELAVLGFAHMTLTCVSLAEAKPLT